MRRESTDEWKSEWFDRWQQSVAHLLPLFQPNNIFAIFGKTMELWENRQTRVKGLKLLADLRPIFDEDASKTIALVLTNTLIVEFVESSSGESRSIHFSMDQDDIEKLREELDRANGKALALANDCKKWPVDLLSFDGA